MRGRWQRLYDRVLLRTGSRESAKAIADRRIAGRSELYMATATRETGSMISLAVGRRSVEDILTDNIFWSSQKALVIGRMEPLMRKVFDEGIDFAKTIDLKKGIGKRDAAEDAEAAAIAGGVEAAALDDAAGEIFRTYVDDWWLGLERTTRNRLRDAIITSSQDGTGTPGVIRAISPLFGEARAKRIGVTETTRLFGRGAQALYKSVGLTHWVWHDVEDDRVCPICDDLNGTVYPMSQAFDPAHTSCRCFAGPA